MDQERPVTRESMLIRFLLTEDGVKEAEIIPAMIERGQPRTLKGETGTSLRRKIKEISSIAPADWGREDDTPIY